MECVKNNSSKNCNFCSFAKFEILGVHVQMSWRHFVTQMNDFVLFSLILVRFINIIFMPFSILSDILE